MKSSADGFTEQECTTFSDLFEFWWLKHAEVGADASWSGIFPEVPSDYPAFEVSARAVGGDPGLIFRREAGRVREFWIERGLLEVRGEFGCFIDAMKALAVTLASQYREKMGYEPFYVKLDGKMPDGVELSVMDDLEVYRLADGDPDRYIPVYGAPGGVLPYLLTRDLSEVNSELLRP